MMLLKSFSSNGVITHLKTIFSLFGIPRVFRSDTRPQFCSHEFKRFSDEWGFNHNIISPTFLYSNGLAEKTAQTLKTLLEKAYQHRIDPCLSSLDYRNTAIGSVSLPAQLRGVAKKNGALEWRSLFILHWL